MSAPESILLKVKLLLNLANSPNPNEAENARAMADKLVAKYNITEEELKSLEDKKPLYGADNKLYSTTSIVGWKQQLALAIGKYFYCHIIQEEMVPTHGEREYNYYVYGDPEDEARVKFVFNTFNKKVEELILTRCVGRGPIYVSSYGEGASEAIRTNMAWEGIDLPEVKAPTSSAPAEEKQLNNGSSNISKHKEEKEKPEENSVDVNSQSLIKDIAAYFRGLDDGKGLFLQEILELEAEELKKLRSSSDEQQ